MLQNSRNVNSTAHNQFHSGASRDALGLDTEGNRENGMDRVQALMQKRREIEERTLDSSNRSLGLLYESERAGAATAEELNRQKEQLKITSAPAMQLQRLAPIIQANLNPQISVL